MWTFYIIVEKVLIKQSAINRLPMVLNITDAVNPDLRGHFIA